MTQLNKQLPFHPLPINGELFKGFILRLAFRNGRDKLTNFMKSMQMPATAQRPFVVGSPEYEGFIDKLALLLGCDKTKLSECFEDEKAIHLFNWMSSARHIVVNDPIICPCCVLSEKYLKSQWHFYYSTHCIEHECKLWRRCPQCNSKFKWHASLFEGCVECGLKWKNVSPIKVEPPLSQIAIAGAEKKAKFDLIERIFKKMNVGLRPFDASFVNPRDVEQNVPCISDHFENAFLIAHSKEVVAKLKEERINQWQKMVGRPHQKRLFQKIDAANDDVFKDVFNQDILIDNRAPKFKEATFRVLTSHRRLNTTKDKARLETKWPHLENVLLLKENEIKSLIKEKILPGRVHINSPSKVSPSRVDDVVTFFRTLKRQALSMDKCSLEGVNGNFIAWGDDKQLRRYRVKTHQLVRHLNSKSINVYAPDHHDHGFEEFYFCRKELDNLFKLQPPKISSHRCYKKTA